MGERKRLFLLVLIMTTVSLVVAGITIYVLYGTSFEQQRERLVEAAQSQARLIEAIARFDAARAETDPESSILSWWSSSGHFKTDHRRPQPLQGLW